MPGHSDSVKPGELVLLMSAKGDSPVHSWAWVRVAQNCLPVSDTVIASRAVVVSLGCSLYPLGE